MVVDVRRSMARQRCRFFRDSDVETEITWYDAPAGARALPVPTVFSYRGWDLPRMGPDHLGEQLPNPPYYRGMAPVDVDGRHFCGSPEVWAEGASINDQPLSIDARTGQPACCRASVVRLVGGVARGGVLNDQPGVFVPCCLGIELPRQLRMTFTNATGHYLPLIGQHAILNWDLLTEWWQASTFSVMLSNGQPFTNPLFACQPFLLLWSIAWGEQGVNTALVASVTCAPFSATGSGSRGGDFFQYVVAPEL